MARDKTFNALDNIFEEDIDFSDSDDLKTPVVESVQEAEEEVAEAVTEIEEVESTPPVAETNPKSTTTRKKRKAKPKPKVNIDFGKKESTVANRTYRMKREIIDALDGIVHDSKGDKIEGSRGFLSDYVNYAVAKELIEVGLLEESYLEQIVNPYED